MGGAFTAVADDLGAVEYNPAGLAQINHINVAALATVSRTSKIGKMGEKTTNWTVVPSYGGAAIKVGPLALGVSRKVAESKNIYQKFNTTQNNIFAPDGWRMRYDTLSDKIDTSGLDTYVLTGALKIGRLSVGANYNAIDGEIEREFSGRVTTPIQRPWWYPAGYNMNDQFQATNTVGLKGYTMDFGALMNMGPLRLGVAAKNAIGKVDVTQKLYWKDNFDMGGSSNWFVYNPLQTKKTLTKFAPTYVAGAALVFFAYIGFDSISTHSEEAIRPQRDVPIGIIASLAFCTVIYIIVSGLLTGIVPYTELGVSSPVSHALQLLGYKWASALVATGVIAGLTTVMLVLYYGLTRIILAMSRDGLLSPFLSKVNQNTQTPVRVIVITGIIMSLAAGLFPLGALAELVNIGTLAAFVLVCLGVIVMRIRHPNLPRPFRNPFGHLFPILGMISCAGLMAFLPAQTWLRFLVWLSIGLIVYFTYSIRHSKLAEQGRGNAD